MVFKNNYLIQLQIKWSLDQTRDIAQCETIKKNVNFNSKQCPKTNLEYNLYRSNSQPARRLTQYKQSSGAINAYKKNIIPFILISTWQNVNIIDPN